MYQIDMVIMSFMQPGKYVLPDVRCVERLVEAIVNPCTLAHSITPDCVLTMMESCAEYNHISFVNAWWEYNEKTHFMRHSDTARMVRMLLKKKGEEGVLEQEHQKTLDLQKDLEDCSDM